MNNQTSDKQIPEELTQEPIDVAYHDDDITYIRNISQLKYHANMKVERLTIICCVSGKMNVAVDDRMYNLTDNSLLIVYPNSVVENCMICCFLECRILCISPTYVQSFLDGKEVINIGLFLKKSPLIHVDKDKLQKFLRLIDVFSVTCDHEHPYYGKIISRVVEATLFAILGFIKMAYKDQIEMKVNELNRGEQTFRRFISMLSKYECTPRNVSYYAGELCISPKYLTHICNEVSGHTASYWIKEYMMKHIKHYLHFSNLSVKEVSTLMGFTNISFFTHYFKMKSGYTPVEYRRICDSLGTESINDDTI